MSEPLFGPVPADWEPGQRQYAHHFNAHAERINALLTAGFITASDVDPLIVAALAEDGTVAAAAAAATVAAAPAAVAAAAAAQDFITGTDLRVPTVADAEGDWVAAATGPLGEFWWGVHADGTFEASAMSVGDGVTRTVDADDVLWVPVVFPDGTYSEVHVDRNGRLQPWACKAIVARAGVPGFSSDAPIDLVILAGQSNATQRGTLPVTVEDDLSDVVTWNGTAFVTATGVPWLGSAFARRYAELRSRLTGRRVGIIPCSVGTTGFFDSLDTGTWDRTITTGALRYLYPEMTAKVAAARAAAPAGSRVVSMLWSQGEHDHQYEAAHPGAYAPKLDDLIAQARTDFAISDLPVIIGDLSPALDIPANPGWAMIRAALEDTPRRLARTAFIPESTNNMVEARGDAVNNAVHWSPIGQRVRGRRMAEIGYEQALLNVTTTNDCHPMENLRVSRSGNTATIRWDHPLMRVTSYTIQVCTDGVGTTWSTVTLTAPTTHRHVTTVTAGTPLWVRGYATNESGVSAFTQEVRA